MATKKLTSAKPSAERELDVGNKTVPAKPAAKLVRKPKSAAKSAGKPKDLVETKQVSGLATDTKTDSIQDLAIHVPESLTRGDGRIFDLRPEEHAMVRNIVEGFQRIVISDQAVTPTMIFSDSAYTDEIIKALLIRRNGLVYSAIIISSCDVAVVIDNGSIRTLAFVLGFDDTVRIFSVDFNGSLGRDYAEMSSYEEGRLPRFAHNRREASAKAMEVITKANKNFKIAAVFGFSSDADK